MTRTTLPAAVALAASTALLLTACGGGSSDNSDKIQSSGTSTQTASASPSGTPTTAAGPGAPTFHLPPDVKVDIQDFVSSDATKKEVLRDTGYAIMAMQEAEATGNGTSANVKRYLTGLHGAEFSDWVIQYRKSGLESTGTVRDYHPTVSIDKSGGAQVTYCEDERQAFDKVIKTGKVKRTTPSLKDFSLWTMGLQKGAAGDWQVLVYHQQKGVKECQVN